MTCSNSGPFHLGISQEACENSGGKWFRSPCITLKEAIDNRPPKFDLEQPYAGNCQQVMGQMNLAYVSAATDNTDFTFASTNQGCLEFCRSLPHYSNQLAMMTDVINVALNKPASQNNFYNGGFPTQNGVDGDRSTHTKSQYWAEDDWWQVDLEEEFAIDRIVVVAGPERLNSNTYMQLLDSSEAVVYETFIDIASNDEQSFDLNGVVAQIVKFENNQAGSFSLQLAEVEVYPQSSKCTCLFQDGMLTNNDEIPPYASKSHPKFFITNPADGSALGIPIGYDCASTELSIEAQVFVGSSRQQFQLTHDHQLVNAACPEKALSADCAAQTVMFSAPSFTGNISEQIWSFDDDGGIVNVDCPDLKLASTAESASVLTSTHFSLINPTSGLAMGIDGADCTDGTNITLQQAVSGSPGQLFYMDDSTNEVVSLLCPNLVVSVSDTTSCDSDAVIILLKSSTVGNEHSWQFNNDSSIESTFCAGRVISIQTNGKLSASNGDQLYLTDPSSSLLHQKWSKSYQQFTISSGPYMFTNPATGMAIGLVDDSCTYGTALEEKATLGGGSIDAKQQFFIGNGGRLHSRLCPGLVVSNNGIDEQLTLETATDDSSKWTIASDGLIESVEYPDAAIGIDGSKIILASKDGTNVALNKPASQNNFYNGGFPTQNGVDGDRSTHTKSQYWAEDDWWQVDLEEEFAIDRIVVVAGPERLNSNTYMQLLDSSEAVVYETFIDIASNDEQSFDLNGVVAQIVKFENNQAGSFSLQLAEVEVYPQAISVSWVVNHSFFYHRIFMTLCTLTHGTPLFVV